MGMRVRVIKKQREYGNTEAFNWKAEEFADLLVSLGCDSLSTFSEYDYNNGYEMLVSEYENAIEVLKCIRDGKELSEENKKIIDLEDVSSALGYLKVEIGRVIGLMEDYYNERDKDCSWIQFEAF